MANGYISVVLDDKSKAMMVAKFPFLYEDGFCHHVTLSFGDASQEELDYQMFFLGTETKEVSIGILDRYVDGSGVECFTVSINGKTLRTDGKKLHLTHSLAKGRKPVESNNVVVNNQAKDLGVNMTITGEITVIKF